MLRLDDGVQDDPTGNHVAFDYVTSETCQAISNYEELDNYIDLETYLSLTERCPPERALMEQEIDQIPDEHSDLDLQVLEEDPTAVRREITDKLIKTMHMEFNGFNRRRKAVVEQALHSHETGKKIFWEVYSGSGNLSDMMEYHGWKVQRFDYDTGWDFDRATDRRAFLELQDEVCPDFIWYAPKCTDWSPLQNLNTLTEERREALEAEREYQEKVHLKMCRRSYLKQFREGRHGALEQPRVRVIEKIQHKPLVSTLHWWTNRFQYFDSILCWKIETICVVFFNTACVVFFNTAKPWNLILGVLNILFFACRYCLISALVRHLLYFLQSLALFQGCPWPGLLHFSITATIFPEYTLWKDSINR